MGRRSRKRGGDGGPVAAGDGSTRAERDAARRERAARARAGKPPPSSRRGSARPTLAERPPPPWAPLPLTELLVLAGVVLMAWGFIGGGGREANAKLVAGLAVASIAGLELTVREHLTGFRSHTTLLSGAVAIATIVLGALLGVDTLGPLAIAAAATFCASFYALRELFKRRSGGVAFR